MKIKYVIIYAGLAAAFAAVSLWVFLSHGKNASAVRAKFRIGGLMLTISSMLAVTGCEGGNPFEVMCYDPVMPEQVVFSPDTQNEVRVGDEIGFSIIKTAYQSHIYEITGEDLISIQSGTLELTKGIGKIKIAETDYRGYIVLTIFGVDADGNNKSFLGSRSFMLK